MLIFTHVGMLFVFFVSTDRVNNYSGTFLEGMHQLTEWTLLTDKL